MHWLHSQNGVFLVKSFKGANWPRTTLNPLWRKFWKMYVPSKLSFFFWTCLKGGLPTIVVLQHHGLILLNAYPLCLQDVESIEHIFIHCLFVSEVWTLFLREIGLSWVFPQGIDMLLLSWEIRNVSRKGRILRSLVCPVVCWGVTKEFLKIIANRLLLSTLSLKT